ncbi:MAG: tetratricopeptide repeat protein [Bacteroidales bacterium]|nr:tetratricopeptide repeat protein [Bacteroidales bacterium]
MRLYSTILLALVFIYSCNNSVPKSTIKKEISELNDPDSVINAYQPLIEMGNLDSHNDIIAKQKLADAYYRKMEYSKAIDQFKGVINYNWREQTVEDQKLIIKSLRGISAAYGYLRKNDSALIYSLKHFDIANELKDSSLISLSYFEIGSDYLGVNNSEKALEYLTKAEIIAEAIPDHKLLNMVYQVKGAYYGEKKRYNKAIDYFTLSKKHNSIYKNGEPDMRIDANIAICYMYMKEYDKALAIHKKAYDYLVKKDDRVNIIRTLRNIAYVYSAKKRYEEAFHYFNIADSIAEKHKIAKIRGDILSTMCKSAEKAKMYEKALMYQKKYMAFKDSLAIEKKAVNLEEIKQRYEEDKRVQEVKYKEREKQLIYLSAIIILILVLLLIFIYFRRKVLLHKKEKELILLREKQIESELALKRSEIFDFSNRINEKNRLLMDLEQELYLLKKESETAGCDMDKIRQSLKVHLIDEDARNMIEQKVESANGEFLTMVKAKHPDVNSDDLQLIGMLRLKFSSKHIAEIMNTSERAIEGRRYRLRKKLELDKGVNLMEYLLRLN